MSNFRGKQVIDFSIIQEKMLIETSTILENLNVTNKEYVESLFNNSIQNLDYWPYDRHLQALDSGTNGVALATDQAITSFPQGQVKVKINGVSMKPGTTASGDYYFSADSGQTSVSQPAKGDLLYWNGELAEFKLETTDNIDFIYVISEDEIVWNTEIQHNNNTAQVVYILDDIAGVANRNKIVFNPDIWLTAEPNVLYWDTTNENFTFNTPQQFINRTYGDFQYRITYDGPSLNTIGSIIGQQFSIENLGQNTILFTPTYHWDASTNNEMAFTGTELDEWYDKTGQLMLSSVNSTIKPTYDSSAQGVRMNNSNFRIRNLLDENINLELYNNNINKSYTTFIVTQKFDPNSTTTQMILYGYNPEQNNQTKYNGNMSFWTGTSITNTANYNNENVISIFNQGASRVFRVDGVENSTNYTSTYHVSNLGIWSNNTYPLDGWIYEFMIFDYEMTLTEIQQVENSLTAKWNPTVTSLVQRNIIPSVSSYNRYPERESDPDQPVLDQNYVEQDF